MIHYLTPIPLVYFIGYPGIRIGTPAITTRGFKEKECSRVAELMGKAMKHKDDDKKPKETHDEIHATCKKFPLPESFV